VRRTANRFGGPILQSYDAKTATVSNFDSNLDGKGLVSAEISDILSFI
jgi:hypothetical protein